MMEYSSTLTIRVGRRPQRSAARPNRKAPIGRIASVSRMAKVTSEISVLNSCAISLSTNTRRKKSNASSVHPRKLAITTLRCSLVHPLRAAIVIFSSEICVLPAVASGGGSLELLRIHQEAAIAHGGDNRAPRTRERRRDPARERNLHRGQTITDN